MAAQIALGDITVDIVTKDIKNVHLSVYPADGKVRISAPLRMDLDTIRVYAISKLAWIKQQQQKIRTQERETLREYIDRESHYLWGKRYLLQVVEADASPAVELSHSRIRLRIRPDSSTGLRQAAMDAWYREKLREAVPPVIAKWESIMAVKVERFFIQRMKTKWGSCSPIPHHIRLNTELAKKPPKCLEYIIIHEMTHLIEPTHNSRFVALMDSFLPNWRSCRGELNRLPVRHEEWAY